MAFSEGVVLLGVLTLLPPAVEQSGSTPTVAGAVTAVFGLAVFVMTRMIVRLTKRLHAAVFIGVGAASAVLACALLAIEQTPAITVIAAVLLGLAWTAMHSSLQTWATEVVPDARATMISLFATALFAGSAVAAAAVAGLVEAGAYGTIFLVSAVLTVPLGLFASVSRARWREP
nr:MFS transporter [Kibdelosporangium sp. MJ126-NF4]